MKKSLVYELEIEAGDKQIRLLAKALEGSFNPTSTIHAFVRAAISCAQENKLNVVEIINAYNDVLQETNTTVHA